MQALQLTTIQTRARLQGVITEQEAIKLYLGRELLLATPATLTSDPQHSTLAVTAPKCLYGILKIQNCIVGLYRLHGI